MRRVADYLRPPRDVVLGKKLRCETERETRFIATRVLSLNATRTDHDGQEETCGRDGMRGGGETSSDRKRSDACRRDERLPECGAPA
jgi:hypothetical protein